MTKPKTIFLPRGTEAIFALLRTHDRFWSPSEIDDVLGMEDLDVDDIDKILKHHSDFKRFAQVPACERCNPLLNKSQTCRHPGSYYAYKILIAGIGILEAHEKRQGKAKDPTQQGEKKG